MKGEADVSSDPLHLADGTSRTLSLRYLISRIAPQSLRPENDSAGNGPRRTPDPCPGLRLSHCPLNALFIGFLWASANSKMKLQVLNLDLF